MGRSLIWRNVWVDEHGVVKAHGSATVLMVVVVHIIHKAVHDVDGNWKYDRGIVLRRDAVECL